LTHTHTLSAVDYKMQDAPGGLKWSQPLALGIDLHLWVAPAIPATAHGR